MLGLTSRACIDSTAYEVDMCKKRVLAVIMIDSKARTAASSAAAAAAQEDHYRDHQKSMEV